MKRTLAIAPLGLLLGTWGLLHCSDVGSAAEGDAGARNPSDAGPSIGAGNALSTSPSHGGAIAISDDDSRLVVVNRDVGTISVFSVQYAASAAPTLTKTSELAVCKQPWEAVVRGGGTEAYVSCREDQKLVRVTGLATTPVKSGEAAVQSEPTGIALTPTGAHALVTNWVDGTVSVVDTSTMAISDTVDLNAALVATGRLGAVTARPALAHPRSIVMTNNRNTVDEDDTILVAEYFAQTKDAVTADNANADSGKVGVVYELTLADTKAIKTIDLPAVADVGFKDHDGVAQQCFPNQSQAIQVNGPFAFVLSVCASSRGPLGTYTPAFRTCGVDGDCPGGAAGTCSAGKCTTNCAADADCGEGGRCSAASPRTCITNPQDVFSAVHAGVSILDLTRSSAIATVSLNRAFNDFVYTPQGFSDDASRRYPLLPSGISFLPDSNEAIISAEAADAVFRVQFNATYANGATIDGVGATGKPFIPLVSGTAATDKQGGLPVGIVAAHGRHPDDAEPLYAFVTNEATRNLVVLDLKNNEIAGTTAGNPDVVATSPPPTGADAEILDGKHLFATGTGRWSHGGQAWGACVQCHVDGLSDNVTWSFARGPRQSLSIDASFSKTSSLTRQFAWSANFDEPSDLETSVLQSQFDGVGACVTDPSLTNASRLNLASVPGANGGNHSGLNGSSGAACDPANPLGLAAPSLLGDWNHVDAFLKTIRTPKRPAGLDPARVEHGRSLFQTGACAGCHGGPLWTISERFYTPSTATMTALKTSSWSSATAAGFPAALLPVPTPQNQTMRYNGADAASFDSIWCSLRNVGTFNVAEAGQGIAEVRQNGKLAQGSEIDGRGFNPPSLLGLAVGAPYLHAGNARTLEALLSPTFAPHHQALSAGFLAANAADTATDMGDLVQFLLSIDADQTPVAIPPTGSAGGKLCAN